MSKRTLRSDTRKAADLVIKVAFEILDEIICPIVGIRGVWADPFMAEPSLYLTGGRKDVAKRKKIIIETARRFGSDEYSLARAWRQPLVIFALAAMSKGGYVRSYGKGKERKLTAKDAWELLKHEDERLARLARERKRKA